MPKGRVSSVWDYFDVTLANKAKCLTCGTEFSRSTGSSTTSQRRHLELKHPETFKLLQEKTQKIKQIKKKQQAEAQTSKEQLKNETKVQLKLSESFQPIKKWTKDDNRSQELDKKIAEMIALDDLPFSHVEDIGFMRLMQKAVPLYDLKCRKFYTLKVDKIYEELRESVSNSLQKFIENGVSFTTDVWSNLTESLLSLTAHGITDDFARVKYILHAMPLGSERHTGSNLSRCFKEMLDGWNIEKENVHVVIRDGGSNIIKAMELSDINSANCCAHQLNLIVQEALKSQVMVKSTVDVCRKIVGHFNRSDPARKKLAEIQLRLNSEKKPLRVKQESPTRWNSTLDMVSRIFEIKEAIALFAMEQNIADWSIQWPIVEKLIVALKPFKEATEMLSANKATLADVIFVVQWLKASSEKTAERDQFGIGSMMHSIRDSLENRFSEIENTEHYAVATYLDPRYKAKFFKLIDTEKIVHEKLEDFLQQKIPQCVGSNAKKPRIEVNQMESLKTFGMESDTSDSETDEMSGVSVIKKELEMYRKLKRIQNSENPLAWWKENKMLLPLLATAVRKYLSTPATSVPSEQLFSHAGLIYEPTRNCLQGERAEKILFVKLNLIETKFSY